MLPHNALDQFKIIFRKKIRSSTMIFKSWNGETNWKSLPNLGNFTEIIFWRAQLLLLLQSVSRLTALCQFSFFHKKGMLKKEVLN